LIVVRLSRQRANHVHLVWQAESRIAWRFCVKRLIGTWFVAALLALGLAGGARAGTELRIGYQKYGTLVLEKARGTLEKRLAPLGVTVTWTEFLGGPALMEAMGAGSIDVGTAGDAPPIFGQAAGVDFVYVGVEPATPHGQAVIVRAGSPIRSVADLRGKRVALNKGSNVHNLLVRVLQANGMTIADVRPVFLKPSDARAAYENGSVDAWAIWDPYYAAAVTAVPSRVLADGVIGGRVVDEDRQFFFARKEFARAHPEIVRAWITDLAAVEREAVGDRAAVAALLTPVLGMDRKAVDLAVGRLGFGIQPITPAVLASQQDIADTFHTLGIIPRAIRVRDAAPADPS
jgi:sulfonate transport system substrate-binding protein